MIEELGLEAEVKIYFEQYESLILDEQVAWTSIILGSKWNLK